MAIGMQSPPDDGTPPHSGDTAAAAMRAAYANAAAVPLMHDEVNFGY